MTPPVTEAIPETLVHSADGAWGDATRWSEIFAEVAAGRVERLADLYDMASRRLYGLALWRTGSRDLAAEVVQEVFVRVAERREQLGEIRGPRWWRCAACSGGRHE